MGPRRIAGLLIWNICYVDFVPHEWLFSQVRGVIHHGGAGMTYAGLRAGCPTFIMAFGGDQLFRGLQENGCKEAADVLEAYMYKRRRTIG